MERECAELGLGDLLLLVGIVLDRRERRVGLDHDCLRLHRLRHLAQQIDHQQPVV